MYDQHQTCSEPAYGPERHVTHQHANAFPEATSLSGSLRGILGGKGAQDSGTPEFELLGGTPEVLQPEEPACMDVEVLASFETLVRREILAAERQYTARVLSLGADEGALREQMSMIDQFRKKHSIAFRTGQANRELVAAATALEANASRLVDKLGSCISEVIENRYKCHRLGDQCQAVLEKYTNDRGRTQQGGNSSLLSSRGTSFPASTSVSLRGGLEALISLLSGFDERQQYREDALRKQMYRLERLVDPYLRVLVEARPKHAEESATVASAFTSSGVSSSSSSSAIRTTQTIHKGTLSTVARSGSIGGSSPHMTNHTEGTKPVGEIIAAGIGASANVATGNAGMMGRGTAVSVAQSAVATGNALSSSTAPMRTNDKALKEKDQRNRTDMRSAVILVGLSVPLFFAIAVFLFSGNSNTSGGTNPSEALFVGKLPALVSEALPVFRFVAMPCLALWMWGLNLYVWDRTNIHHCHLFRFNPTTALGHLQVFKIAAFLTFLCSLCFLLFMFETGPHNYYYYYHVQHHTHSNINGYYSSSEKEPLSVPSFSSSTSPAGQTINTTTVQDTDVWPIFLVVFVFAMFFCPLNIAYKQTRVYLMRALLSVALSPFGAVNFATFYIADVMTSMTKTLQDGVRTLCFVLRFIFSSFSFPVSSSVAGSTNETFIKEAVCRPLFTWAIPVLAFTPQYWRLMQCLRRYQQTSSASHIANACKYGLAICVALISWLEGDLAHQFGSAGITRQLWILLFILSTLYSAAWDFFMDWGFGYFQKGRCLPLRKRLFYSSTWIYVYLIVSNLLFRFFWMLTISRLPFQVGIGENLLGWIAATVEIVRRFTWSLLRVENEYLGSARKDILFSQWNLALLPFGSEEVPQRIWKRAKGDTV